VNTRILPTARGRSDKVGILWPLWFPFAFPRLLFPAALLA
jgi:hypothetical protein